MKRIISIIVVLVVCWMSGYAQTESKRDSIPIKNELQLPQNTELKGQEQTMQQEQRATPTLSKEELERRAEFVRKMKLETPAFYVGPATEHPSLGEKLPFNKDYSYYDFHDLGNNVYWGGGSLYKSYPTIGALQMVRADLSYQPTDWLGISGGIYGAKYTAYGNYYNDAGVNASFRFKLSDKVYLRAHGSYSINSNDKTRYVGPASMGMFPQSYYGGGIEFKFNDNFGVEGGMMREFNPMKRKWENIPYLMPVFYSNGRRK